VHLITFHQIDVICGDILGTKMIKWHCGVIWLDVCVKKVYTVRS